ncbi:MAG: hypothetical protein M1829_000437 [Trizodia sp. TS-e1964]|nr:MAG: hypothetical protein M1829_000437 [Trizodia sp. TS-e1964]
MDDKHFTPGKPYSGANPIPNIQRFIDSLDKDKKERDKHVEDTKTDVAKPHESKPSDGVKGTKKTVTDPTTGGEVLIEDVDKDFIKAVENPQLSVPLANLGKETSVKTEASQSGEEYKRTQDITAPPDPVAPNSTADVPIHGEKTNILFHPTPSISYEPTFQRLEQRAWIICIGILAAIVILGKIFGGSLWGLFPTGVVVATGVWLWMKEVVRSGREVEWESEKNRGQIATQNLIPESVEWLNALMGIVWGLINPEMFVSVADTLEDVMQASLPGIVENVRVAEINQGNNPIRILSLRSLPDSHVSEITNEIHELNKKTKDQQEAAADEESGSYYNIEVSFAYHAQPSGRGLSSKARNLHMELIFYLGIKGLFGIPLPIWVELQGLVGTVRLRLHMTPEPPFL